MPYCIKRKAIGRGRGDTMSDQRAKTWKAVVDRIESTTAVVLIGDQEIPVDVPVSLLPNDIKEGTHLSAVWSVDPEATKAAEKRVTSLLQRLLAQSPPTAPEEHD